MLLVQYRTGNKYLSNMILNNLNLSHVFFLYIFKMDYPENKIDTDKQSNRISPASHIPPLTLIPQHLKTVAPRTFCFFRGIHPNGLHSGLTPQAWIYSEKSYGQFSIVIVG